LLENPWLLLLLLQNLRMFAFCRRHRWWVVVILAVVVIYGWVQYRMWGPYRAYQLDLAIRSNPTEEGRDRPLEVGVAKRDITPDLSRYDSWVDVDGNGRFELHRGDRFDDRNRNGTYDLVWLGGFDMNRPAKGVNDPLWVRAMALRHKNLTLVMVTIDCVGLTHERFIRIRKSIDHERHGIAHILFSSTHTHNSPDTMGIWSGRPLFSKFDEVYVGTVLAKAREAILEAVQRLEPVEVTVAATRIEPKHFVKDSRMPEVFDRELCAVRFESLGDRSTVATLVSWGNHPEAMGGDNALVSSDFVHYWREGVERGVPEPAGAVGLGGMCLFFQGSVGGLMTPLGVTVPDRDGLRMHRENGVGKTRALGENLALRTLTALRGGEAVRMEEKEIGLVAKTIFAPIEGSFRLPVMLGLIHPGWYDGRAKSEVDAVRIGDLEILTIPGELYPEIAEGGVESPEGSDYSGKPREVPPLRPQMRGSVNMVFNLANDEIGYIIPRTQWDTAPPYTYGESRAPYGEVNSGGPDVASVIHEEALEALRRLHEMMDGRGG
jgi:hypothetical protein